MKWIPVTLVALAAAVLGVVLLLGHGPEDTGMSARPGTVAQTDPQPAPDRLSITLPEVEDETAGAPVRVAVSPPTNRLLSGRVESASGQPIDGGLASWSPLISIDPGGQEPWWSAAREVPTLGTSPVTGGGYEFGQQPVQQSESYVVVTHPSHYAGVVAVPESLRPGPLQLEPAEPVLVLVREGDGSPAARAEVVSLGIAPLEEGHVAMRRTYDSDPEGRSRVAPLPDESILLAHAGDRRSPLWYGRHNELDGPVVLVLSDTFSASGKVLGARSREAAASCEVLVRRVEGEREWARSRADESRILTSSSVGEGLTWRIESIPWVGPGEYVFRMQGDGTAPREVYRTVEAPGEHVIVDFDWETGHTLEFRITNEEAEPLEDVQVVAGWRDEDNRWVRYTTRSDTQGRALFENCPEVIVWVRTYAAGFANQVFGSYLLPLNSGEVFELVLRRACLVRGRCLHEGEPVSSFTVTYWSETPIDRSRKTFEDSPDGSFELNDAPSGTMNIFASSDDLAACKPVLVETGVEEVTEVVLELTRGLAVHGRVIDGASGEPLSGASLQVYHRFRGQILEPWGPQTISDVSGRFSGVRMAPQGDILQVALEDYGKEIVSPPAPASGDGDLGVIALGRLQDLRVRLVSSRPMDFGDYLVGITGRSPQPSGPDGFTVLRDVRPGRCPLEIYPPNGGRIDTDVDLVPGSEWLVEVSAATPRTLIVRLEPDEGVEVPDDIWLDVTYLDRTGTPSRCIVPIADYRSELENVLGESILIDVVRVTGEFLASTWVRLPDEDLVEVTLSITGRSATLLFLDMADNPVPRARVTVMAPQDPSSSQMVYTTDDGGRLELKGMQADEILVRVKPDYDKLARSQRVVLDPSSTEPIIVRVDLGSRIRALFAMRGLPAAGVPVSIFEPDGRLSQLAGTTTQDGELDVLHLSPGDYLLRVGGSGYYPAERLVWASPDPEPVPIQIRRLGTATLRVTAEGLPVKGLRLGIAYGEQAGSIADRLAQDLLERGEDVLTTDVKGEVRLAGIPDGAYTWTVEMPDGASLQGTFVVPPLESVVVSVMLP